MGVDRIKTGSTPGTTQTFSGGYGLLPGRSTPGSSNRLILNFATQLVAPVTRADCRILGRLLLGRFDQDRLSIKPATPVVGTTVCRLIELPAEMEGLQE